MSYKRKYNMYDEDDTTDVNNKKHTLDSDEEDSDDYEKDDNVEGYVDGEEDGVAKVQDDVKITPFNMREELEEGQFDKDGHYHWNKADEIKDNWLDDIDWVKIEENSTITRDKSNENPNDVIKAINEADVYKNILSYMERHETVSQTLHRLGRKSAKLSTIERIKRKKRGEVDADAEKVTKITELVDNIMTMKGDMDVYQLKYEEIQSRIKKMSGSKTSASCSGADMYSDDFNEKELQNLKAHSEENKAETTLTGGEGQPKNLLWEFKWTQEDPSLQGPYETEKMLEFSRNGHFKTGVFVRKVGENSNFYTSNRIDFDLYL